MFQRASFLMKKGDNIVAKKLLKRCLELNQYDAHSWLALARLEARTGHLGDAAQTFQTAVTHCPNNIHLLHAWGHFEQKHGTLEKARDCWSKAMKIDPLNAYVGHALCLLEQRLGNHDRAREILWKLVRAKPTSALCVALSDHERRRGELHLAKQVLLDGLERCREEKDKIYLALAWLEETMFNNISLALDYIQKALHEEERSGSVRAHVAKASLLLRNQEVEKAKETLRNATHLIANDGQHYTMLSTIELETGNIDEARRVIEEGAAKFPGDQFLLQRWGSFEAKYGNVSTARSLFEKSVLIQPHAPTFVSWALLEEEEGRKALNYWMEAEHRQFLENLRSRTLIHPGHNPSQEELKQLEEAVEILSDKDHVKAYARKQLSVARQLFSIGMEVNRQHGPIYHAFGNMELRHGNTTGARMIFWKGIRSNCSDIASLYHALGLLEIKNNNIAGAREILQAGITIALQVNGIVSTSSGTSTSSSGSISHGINSNNDNYEELLRNTQDGLNILSKFTNEDNNDYTSSSPNSIRNVGSSQGMTANYELHSGVSYLLHSLGMLEYDQYRYESAKNIFLAGVALYPNHSQLLLGLALVYAKLHDEKAARRYFKASITANSLHLHAWQAWAVFEKSLQNYQLARILFKEGLKYGPDHSALWQAYAVMEMQLGNYDIARNLFLESISRNGNHAQSYQAWACLEIKTGNLQAASRLVYEGMRRCGSHAALWTIAAVVESRAGDRLKAKFMLERGIERFPNHGALYKVLGELEVKDGNYTQAREWFRLGLERDPYYASTYHVAALMEARLGNLERLSELHYRAKELFNQQSNFVVSNSNTTATTSLPHPSSVGNCSQATRHDQQESNQSVYNRIDELHRAVDLRKQHSNHSGVSDELVERQYESEQEFFLDNLARYE
eukprot:gene5073-5572_t